MPNREISRARGRIAPVILTRRAIAATVISLATLTVGCSSSSGDAFDEYAGTWKLSADTTKVNHFRLTCPSLSVDTDSFSFFTNVTLEPGTVSDLYDTAGPGSCQFAYDVVPGVKALSLVNPDPFTGMAASCTVDLGTFQDSVTFDTIDELLVITPASWLFNLQPTLKGKPPVAQLLTHAIVDINDIDTTMDPPKQVKTSACTYDITENLDKVSRL